MMSRIWLIKDISDPPATEHEGESIVARASDVDSVIAVFERLRPQDDRCLLVIDELLHDWFMIGLGRNSVHARHAPAATPQTMYRLEPVSPTVTEALRYRGEQEWIDVPPEWLFTVEQFYELFRFFEANGIFPSSVRLQYDWK